MKGRSLPQLLLALTAGALLLGQTASSFAAGTVTTKDQDAILATVAAIRTAILNGDTAQLSRHISESQGLNCTDTHYSSKQIARFLKDTGSDLYMSLFDSAGFARQCGSNYPMQYPAISDREFLQTAEDSASIEAYGHDWVEVTIRSRMANHATRTWSLHRERDGWKLAGRSLIIGNCSCG